MTHYKITPEILEEIKNRIDIVEIVGERVSLKKMGINFKGLCPFHNEKTPSFVVNSQKQIFHCFGCNIGGDAISFVEKINSIPFPEAVEILANRSGIKLPEYGSAGRSSVSGSTSNDEKNVFFEINIAAKDFFISAMQDKKCTGYIYAKKRELNDDIIKEFQLGYATTEWEDLSRYLLEKGHKLSNIVSLGLTKEKNQKYYDVFRNRLIFPILNHRGDTVGFGGRLLEDNPEMPKYLNSPETPVYRKGDTLYGLYITQKYIREAGYAVVVEGYMDFLSLYAAGIKNVVATLGTSFTEKQVALIKRYTERVVMFYDGDEPGKKAAMRSLPSLLEGKLQVDAYFLENELDPDEAVKELGVENIQKNLKNAKPLLGYLMNSKLIYGLPLNEVMKHTNEILGYVALIPDQLTRIHWIKELSLRSNIDIRELNKIVASVTKPEKLSSQPYNIVNPHANIRPKNRKIDPLSKNLIKVLFLKPDLINSVFDEERDFYLPKDVRLLLHKMKEYANQNRNISVSEWIALSKEAEIDWIADVLSAEILSANSEERQLEKEFNGCLLQFHIRYLEEKYSEQLRYVREGENSLSKLKELEVLKKEINNLKQNRVSLNIQEVTR